jgi:hypothetical protein
MCHLDRWRGISDRGARRPGGGRNRNATGATEGRDPRREIPGFRRPPGFAYDTGRLGAIHSLDDRYDHDVDELMA